MNKFDINTHDKKDVKCFEHSTIDKRTVNYENFDIQNLGSFQNRPLQLLDRRSVNVKKMMSIIKQHELNINSTQS